MKLLGLEINRNNGKEPIKEEIKAFSEKGDFTKSLKALRNQRGEGWENLEDIPGYGKTQVHGFNLFYDNYINKKYEDEIKKIFEYRQMASTPEISDVIEDAVNESTQEDDIGEVFHLNILDPKLQENENIVKNIKNEFNDLFKRKIDMKGKIWDILWTFYIDGRVYYERVADISDTKKGIVNIKKLPTETMDFFYDPISGRITGYIQYKGKKVKKPSSIEEARKRDGSDLIFFDPNQIGFVDSGIYRGSRYEIVGYLDKAMVPFNQLKLLETAVIIARIVRAPERFVFKIDTGSMPKEKALKYVEMIKKKMQKKQTYDPKTGLLTNESDIMGILENFFIPQSADGRGSDIDTIGGNTAQFSELDDIYYFQKKLYKALKYPGSRVSAIQEGRSGEDLFGGQQTSEISRDEVKWASFLEIQQKKICRDLRDMFLLHLEFKGFKKQYSLDGRKISVSMNPPSRYKEQMEQAFNDSRFNNYQQLADRNQEFSRYYLMKRFLKWSHEEIMENVECKKKDIELGLAEESEDKGF